MESAPAPRKRAAAASLFSLISGRLRISSVVMAGCPPFSSCLAKRCSNFVRTISRWETASTDTFCTGPPLKSGDFHVLRIAVEGHQPQSAASALRQNKRGAIIHLSERALEAATDFAGGLSAMQPCVWVKDLLFMNDLFC